MNYKTLLAVFIIIAIGVMLLRTDSGREYLSTVGNVFSGLFAGGGLGGGGSTGPFGMIMNVDRTAFLGQSFSLQNSSVSISGLADSPLRIGGVQLRKSDLEAVVEMDNAKGVFEYTVAGTVKFEGTAERVVVDGNTYSPFEKELKVDFEMVPLEFLLTGLNERRIIISSATGSIARLNPDGSIKSTEELAAEHLEIFHFTGYLEFQKGNNAKLDGIASAVRGTSGQSSFNW